MKFFQRGRGQTQSNTRAERDTQLVLLDRIDTLNRTIDDLSIEIEATRSSLYAAPSSATGRILIGLERRYVNTVRERDQAIEQLITAPLDDANSFGKNAPAAGGGRKRRGGTSLMKVGDCMFPISDVDRFCQDNEEEVMDGLVYEEDGCRATVGVNDCITAWSIMNDVMQRVPSGGSKVLTEFAKRRIKILEKNGAIIYNKYYGKEAVKEAEYVFFPSGQCCGDIEKNNTAARKWNSDWTPSEIDNAVYFTYAIIAKDNSHYMKHARLIIGNSDLDVSIGVAHHGIRKGRRTRKRRTKKRDSAGKCKKLTGKKYRTRSSPSYSAQDCPNMKKKGNDGNYYISTQNKSKIYTWKKL